MIPIQVVNSKPNDRSNKDTENDEANSNWTFTGTYVSFNFNNTSGEIANYNLNGNLLFSNISVLNFTLQKMNVDESGLNANGRELKYELSDAAKALINIKAKQQVNVSFLLPTGTIIEQTGENLVSIDWTVSKGLLEIDKGSTISVDNSYINCSLHNGRNLEITMYPSDTPGEEKKEDKDKSELIPGFFNGSIITFEHNLTINRIKNVSIKNVTVFSWLVILNGSFNGQHVSPNLFKGYGIGADLHIHDNPNALIQIKGRENLTVIFNITDNWSLNQSDSNVTLSKNNLTIGFKLVGKPKSDFLKLTNSNISVYVATSGQLKLKLLNNSEDKNMTTKHNTTDNDTQKNNTNNDDTFNDDATKDDSKNNNKNDPKNNPKLEKRSKDIITGNFSGRYLAFEYNLSADKLINVSMYNSTIFNSMFMENSSFNNQHASNHLFKGTGAGAKLIAHDNPIALIQVLARENITVILNITDDWALNHSSPNVTLSNDSMSVDILLVGKPLSYFIKVTDSNITILLSKSSQLQIRLINISDDDNKEDLPGSLWFSETQPVILNNIGFDNVGGDITITGPYDTPEVFVNIYVDDFNIEVDKVLNKEIVITLSSDEPTGKFVLLSVLKETLGISSDSKVVILIDDSPVTQLDEISTLTTAEAGFYRTFDSEGEQILISVSHFSEHKITIQFIPTVDQDIKDRIWSYWDYLSVIGILIVILIAGLYLVVSRREYY